MAIVPRDLLDQAVELIARAETMPDMPSREALLRTVVGRAYYAVYHAALVRARRVGYASAPLGLGSHEGLWQWFLTERPDLSLADAGTRLKRERTRADYRLADTLTLSRARAVVADAWAAFDLVRGGGLQ